MDAATTTPDTPAATPPSMAAIITSRLVDELCQRGKRGEIVDIERLVSACGGDNDDDIDEARREERDAIEAELADIGDHIRRRNLAEALIAMERFSEHFSGLGRLIEEARR